MPNKKNIDSPIIVVSSPRSGTTLISEMFKKHPDFSSVGETANLLCDSWHAVEFARGVTIPTIENKQILATEEKAGRVVRNTFQTLFPDNKAYWFQKPIGLPKALSNHFDHTQWDEAAEWYWKIYKHAFPNAKLFTLLRHPCDVVLSTAKHLGFEPAATWSALGFMAYILAHPSSPIDYAVHYEVLIQNQESVVTSLFDYLDVPYHPDMLEAFKTIHIPSRGRESLDAISTTRQGEWAELDPAIIDPYHFEQIENLFTKFGYSIIWPEHFKALGTGSDNDDGEPDEQALRLTIKRLHRNIESIHLDYSTRQIELHNQIYKANLKANEAQALARQYEQQVENILQSRAGRWLTTYWAKADQLKGIIHRPEPTPHQNQNKPQPTQSKTSKQTNTADQKLGSTWIKRNQPPLFFLQASP